MQIMIKDTWDVPDMAAEVLTSAFATGGFWAVLRTILMAIISLAMMIPGYFRRPPVTQSPECIQRWHGMAERQPSPRGQDSSQLVLITILRPPPRRIKTLVRQSVGVGMCLMAPLSRGEVRLASSDPGANPLIDPKYLTQEGASRSPTPTWHRERRCVTSDHPGAQVIGTRSTAFLAR